MQKIPNHAIAKWLQAQNTPYGIACALTELRERRAADLSSAEVEALEWCRILLDCNGFMLHQRHDPMVATHVRNCERALAVLDKIIARHG